MIELTGNNVVLVGVVAVIGLAALVVAGILVREVLAASEGTERMKEIGAAVQEGAAAYLNRQFKTLSIFAVVVFFLLGNNWPWIIGATAASLVIVALRRRVG